MCHGTPRSEAWLAETEDSPPLEVMSLSAKALLRAGISKADDLAFLLPEVDGEVKLFWRYVADRVGNVGI
jgi:hypothetical protein